MRLRALLLLSAPALGAQMIVVSPDGPVRTLVEARDTARAQRRAGANGNITIQIRDGLYFLKETLVLTPEDSNTVWEAAPGARPAISGGRVISGWTKASGPIWTAEGGEAYFHQLFISGRRAQRARTPNFGFYRIDGASPTNKPIRLSYRGNDIKPQWAGSGAEVIGLLAWADFRMAIASVDETAHVATLTLDPRPSNQEADARYYIENAPDGLDSAGEWYLNRSTHTVSYWPVAGENMQTEQVIAPALVQLVRLEGKPEQQQFVRKVTFHGLQFEHADWTMDEKGYADTQAAIPAAAAIEGIGALDTKIEKCTVAHSGGYAIFFGRGSKRTQVLASELFDLGAGGIKLGEARQFPNDDEQNYENVVADNHIHDLGLVYAPAVGVWVLESGRNRIVHNHIHDLFYTAISVGWTWGYGPNQSKGNVIEYNHLHDIGKEMLSDIGGIYTLGVQPGTRIRNNLIHDIASFTYGGWGIYPDEGSSEMLIENNIVYNCKSAGFHQHYGRENIVRNNIWAFNQENQLMRTRTEQHVSFTFERNIVYFDQGRLLGSNWNDDKYVMKGNVYFDTRGPNIRFAGRSFQEWKTAGRDTASIIADPLFVNVSNFDFRLRPESPALEVGFQQIDMAGVGPRVPAGQ